MYFLKSYIYVFIDFFLLNITDWVEAAWSITDLPPAAPGILLLLLLVDLGLLGSSFLLISTIWTHSIMRWQATYHYYRECAILQLQIFGIWKSSPATPKTGVWQKPVLAVGNWSRPIISQSAREREKKELSVDQAKEQGWEWAHIVQKVFFYFCIDDFIRWGTLSQYIF